jgi:hypothetical protein
MRLKYKEYFVTKKIVKMIVLEMDIVRMEFVIVIIHIVETIVSWKNALINAVRTEFANKESANVKKYLYYKII